MMKHAAQLAIIKKVSRQESRSSAGNYQADHQAGTTKLRWQLSSRGADRNHAAQLAFIKEMSKQESCRSAGNNPADEQPGITQLSWQ